MENTLKVKVKGMHCPSCEILVEREFTAIKGIEKVKSDYSTCIAEITYTEKPTTEQLENALKSHGYSILEKEEKPDYAAILLFFFVAFAIYYALKILDITPKIGISEKMSLGFVFVLGLVASTSTCLVVSGGLLLAVMSRFNEMHPGLNAWQKFRPNLYFNAGRIISYTLFGAVIGFFGSLLTLSTMFNGILTLAASLVMVLLGFQLLRIFPWLQKLQLKMPKFIGHKMHSMRKEHWAAPLMMGAGTFFLPCGFTIALQLYVLSKGSAANGALTMLIFSIGTLPSLISLGAIASFVKGQFQKNFLVFAGVIVIMLGFFNISSGLNMLGLHFEKQPSYENNLNPYFAKYMTATKLPDEIVKIIDNKQVAEMKIDDLSYIPPRFVVKKGIPVVWKIDSSKAAGCAQVITMPDMKILEYLSPDEINTITFVPGEEGTHYFSCTMGMTTPGAYFKVV